VTRSEKIIEKIIDSADTVLACELLMTLRKQLPYGSRGFNLLDAIIRRLMIDFWCRVIGRPYLMRCGRRYGRK
jgi:hypothetical protein